MIDFANLGAHSLLLTRSEAIIAADRDGIIRFWNPGAERIFGYVRDDAIGRSLDLIIPERLQQRHWDGYRRTMASGKSRRSGKFVSFFKKGVKMRWLSLPRQCFPGLASQNK